MCSSLAQAHTWDIARLKPAGYLKILESKPLSLSHHQISCAHLSFRYRELERILSDIGWVATAPVKAGQHKWEAHEYLMERLRADPRPIAEAPAFSIKFKLDSNHISTKDKAIDAFGILGAVKFSLMPIALSETGAFEVKLDVNSYDICAKKYIEIFVFRDCLIDSHEGALPYDWQACADVEVYRVSLKSYANKIGFRKREIKREL